MLAGFDWWLLVLGLVVGAGFAWLLLADFRRHEVDIAADELEREAEWIAEQSENLQVADVLGVLELHRAYLASTAPNLDALDDAAWYEPAD